MSAYLKADPFLIGHCVELNVVLLVHSQMDNGEVVLHSQGIGIKQNKDFSEAYHFSKRSMIHMQTRV